MANAGFNIGLGYGSTMVGEDDREYIWYTVGRPKEGINIHCISPSFNTLPTTILRLCCALTVFSVNTELDVLYHNTFFSTSFSR